MSVSQDEWASVWDAVLEIAEGNPGLVFIDGVAVYLHISNHGAKSSKLDLIEFSHDADACVSIAEFADIRDFYVVTPNRRLNKHQAIVRGEEVDLYVERNNGLAIPYDEILARTVTFDGVNAACLEHLLILKLDAAEDRRNSVKGEKDQRDIIKIGYLLSEHVRTDIVAPYLSDARLNTLKATQRSNAFNRIALGNSFEAKQLRESFDKMIAQLQGTPPRWARRR